MQRLLPWLATLGGVFVAIALLVVVNNLSGPLAKALLPATSPHSVTATKSVQYFSELSPDGFLKSPNSPEPLHIAAGWARSLFRATRWDEFVVTAERLNNAGRWTVHIEPKSGGRDDIMWVTGQADHVTSFGFRRRDKLKGYTGKSMKGAEPGFCR
jgi:hypothetical protein